MKLAAIRVVDLSVFLPGPMLTMMMADQGADVLKVEPPGGDPARQMAPFEAGRSVWFRNMNRGKRSVELDLKSDAGRERLWDEIDAADVFVEAFRPGAVGRLGFGADAVRARNPRIVYASLSAFGQTGPLAHHPAHDLAVEALSGFLSVNDGLDGTPVVPGVPAADMALALTGLSAILMALLGRERTGRGDYIDASMLGALLPFAAHIAGSALTGGEPPRSATQRSLGGAAFYNVYACSDGRHVVLGGRETKFVQTLLDALGRPDLIPVGEAEPGEAQAPLRAFLAQTFATRTRDEWTAWFERRDVAFAPVLDFREAFALHEGAAVTGPDGAAQIAPAIRFADDPPFVPRPAP